MNNITERDAGDLLDRWSIARLKSERIGEDENHRENLAFTDKLKVLESSYPSYDWNQFTKMMYDINSTIWCLEAAMKSGKESLPNPHYLDDKANEGVLTSIGKNAILIRNINGFRVGLKNIVNKLLNQGFMDLKFDHMSVLGKNEN